MAGGQGLPGSQFPGEDDLPRRVKDLERQLRELAAANQLGTAGIRAVDGGIVVEGSMQVDGSETVNGPLLINGPATITGALSLPAGIIGNDALAAPLEPQVLNSDADGFTLTPAEQDFCVTTFTVPAGYKKAVIIATGTVNGYNTNAAADYLWARAYINTSYGRRMFALMNASSGPASLTVNKQTLLTDLVDGQIITCKLRLSSQVADVTSASNGASMNAYALFTR